MWFLVMDKYDNDELSLTAYFGGSFDPLHEGHIHCAQAVCERLKIEYLYLLPCNASSNKKPEMSAKRRLEYMRQMLEKQSSMRIDSRELNKGGVSYTINTLKEIRGEKRDSILVYVIGEDVLLTIDKWKSWKDLLKFCHIVVIKRQGVEGIMPVEVNEWYERHFSDDEWIIKNEKSGYIFFWDVDAPDISSTRIRQLRSFGD